MYLILPTLLPTHLPKGCEHRDPQYLLYASAKEGRASNFREKSLVSLTYDLTFCAIGLTYIQEKLIADLAGTLKRLCVSLKVNKIFEAWRF